MSTTTEIDRFVNAIASDLEQGGFRQISGTTLRRTLATAVSAALPLLADMGNPISPSLTGQADALVTQEMVEAALQSTVPEPHTNLPWREVVDADAHADFIADMRAAIEAALAAAGRGEIHQVVPTPTTAQFAPEYFELFTDGTVSLVRQANKEWPEWAADAARRYGYRRVTLAARQPAAQVPQGSEFTVSRTMEEAESASDGMLPAALVAFADEWYRLCERRFAVDRIRISGQLAEAIVEAVCAAQPAQGIDLGPGVRAIADERKRQVNAEGYSAENDADYKAGELANAALAYVQVAAMDLAAGGRAHVATRTPPACWPWHRLWWKPRDARRDLVRAGALIAAQLDAIDSQPEAAPAPRISQGAHDASGVGNG